MNQFIVITIILNYFKDIVKHIKANLINLGSCCLGLLFFLYINDLCNSIQEQHIWISTESIGSPKQETSLNLLLGYSSAEDMPSNWNWIGGDTTAFFSNGVAIRSIFKITEEDSLYISRDSLLNIEFKNDEINTIISKSKFPVTSAQVLCIQSDYIEQKFHLPWSARERALWNKNIIKEDITDYSEEIVVSRKWSVRKADKKVWYNMIESYASFYSTDSVAYVFQDPLFVPFDKRFSPEWSSLYDVSKFKTKIFLNTDDVKCLSIYTFDLTDFHTLYPEPDIRKIDYIQYTDSLKLTIIREKGLDLYMDFPNLYSKQQNRNYIISAFITLFFTLLFPILYKIIRIKYARFIKRKSICLYYISSNRSKYAHKIYKPMILYFSMIYLLVGSIVAFFNYFDFSVVPRIAEIPLIVSTLVMISCNISSKQLLKSRFFSFWYMNEIYALSIVSFISCLIVTGFSFHEIGSVWWFLWYSMIWGLVLYCGASSITVCLRYNSLCTHNYINSKQSKRILNYSSLVIYIIFSGVLIIWYYLHL